MMPHKAPSLGPTRTAARTPHNQSAFAIVMEGVTWAVLLLLCVGSLLVAVAGAFSRSATEGDTHTVAVSSVASFSVLCFIAMLAMDMRAMIRGRSAISDHLSRSAGTGQTPSDG